MATFENRENAPLTVALDDGTGVHVGPRERFTVPDTAAASRHVQDLLRAGRIRAVEAAGGGGGKKKREPGGND